MPQKAKSPPAATGGAQKHGYRDSSDGEKDTPNVVPPQGETPQYAHSPLERLRWIGQVQGHPDSVPEDVTTAVAIARFVHSKRGETLCGHDLLARILRVKPRQFRNRLSHLKDRGHVEIRRRRRLPAGIAIILLPDCIMKDVQPDCTSSDDQDRQHECRSDSDLDRQSYYLSKHVLDRQSDYRSYPNQDRQSQSSKTGNDQKIDGLKTDTYGSLNRGITGEYRRTAEFREHEIEPESENCFPESHVKKNGHGDGVAARPEGAPANDHDAPYELNPGPGAGDEPLLDLEPIRPLATRCKAALTREVALDRGVDEDVWEREP